MPLRQVLCPTLIGRHEELRAIDAALERRALGRGGAIMLTGVAGIGKSRLAQEAGSRAAQRHMRVLWGMAGATIFLPFLPMLPSQILLNNVLYDLSRVTIPTDRVDSTYLQKLKRWNVSFIQRFMLLFGPLSSVYDFLTFFVLLRLSTPPSSYSTPAGSLSRSLPKRSSSSLSTPPGIHSRAGRAWRLL